ncbi:MAG: hypothetical protein U0744_19095 [Gemmataceae bacterium]
MLRRLRLRGSVYTRYNAVIPHGERRWARDPHSPALAGHIDHGKTSSSKPSLASIAIAFRRKARGTTIDIGFATLDLGEYRPRRLRRCRHERFIKNMLAGATGSILPCSSSRPTIR